jgi:hypothetical protein
VNISATSKNLTDALMYSKERMRKCKRSKYTQDTMVPTKDGRSFILTRKRRLLLREWTQSLVSISIDHSTLDQDCHSKE